MNTSPTVDPFQILGVTINASEAEVRARYLELVKQFPPERDPEKFREVREAYDVVKDPLSIARRMIEPPDKDNPSRWSDALEEQKRLPPRLAPAFLLSLGNRKEATVDDRADTGSGNVVSGSNSPGDQKQHRVDQSHE